MNKLLTVRWADATTLPPAYEQLRDGEWVPIVAETAHEYAGLVLWNPAD